MVTTIKITGDGVFIQSNGGVGGGVGGSRHQHQQHQLTAAALGEEATLPTPGGGSLVDTVDSSAGGAGVNDTNNNHKGYRNFNHRRYQSDEGPGLTGAKNGVAASGSSSEMIASGESDDTIGGDVVDASRKRDKFTISFLNTHRNSGGLPNGGGHGKSMLNHKFIVYNSKKPKTSSVLHQQYYQQSVAADGGSGSGSPPLPLPYQSHYQQYLYNRLRPSLSTSVLSSPSLMNGTAGTGAGIATPSLGGRPADLQRDRDLLLQEQEQQQQQQKQQHLYQNGLFHQQHRALLGTPPAAVPGWAKSTSCLVSASNSTTTASTYSRTVTASPLLLFPSQPASSNTTPRPVPSPTSTSSLSSPFSSSPSSSAAGSPPASGANSSSNSPPPPPVSTDAPSSPSTPCSTAPPQPSGSSATPTSSSPASKSPSPTVTAAPSTPTSSPPPPPPSSSNLGQ
uniref:Uncharacterized protein n=1 Tax=Anopheles dirus TaxID=7168 RepID=A0A182N6G5_9DIPT